MMNSIKKAFTLLELILVIVILGIVGLIVTDIISNVYTTYIISQRVNELQLKTEYFLEQLSNRLQYRIKDSTIGKKSNDDTNYTKLDNIPTGKEAEYNILEWIGYSYEALDGEFDTTKGMFIPAYSGLIDVDSNETSNSQFLTTGSNLDKADNILSKISNGDIDLSNDSAAIFFATVRPINEYWEDASNTDSNTSFVVSRDGNDKFILADARSSIDIYERYYLAWSAYAIVPVKSKTKCAGEIVNPTSTATSFDLCLFYNYQPWLGYDYKDAKRTLLMENVTSLRFKSVDNFIRLKICIDDSNVGGAYNVQKNSKSAFGFCKEKAIF